MRAFAERHPNLTTWFVLALGMLIVLAWSARDVDLTPRQFFWLGVATVLLAGLCAWIISWEADEPEAEGESDEDGQPPGAFARGAASGAAAGGERSPVARGSDEAAPDAPAGARDGADRGSARSA